MAGSPVLLLWEKLYEVCVLLKLNLCKCEPGVTERTSIRPIRPFLTINNSVKAVDQGTEIRHVLLDI